MLYKIIFYKIFAPSLNQFVQVSHLDEIFAEQKPRLDFFSCLCRHLQKIKWFKIHFQIKANQPNPRISWQLRNLDHPQIPISVLIFWLSSDVVKEWILQMTKQQIENIVKSSFLSAD